MGLNDMVNNFINNLSGIISAIFMARRLSVFRKPQNTRLQPQELRG